MNFPYVDPDFLTPRECSTLIDVMNSYARREANLIPTRRTERRIEIAARTLVTNGLLREAQLMEKIRGLCKQQVDRIFDFLCPLFPEFTMLQSNYPGDSHPRHADNAKYDRATGRWLPNHTPQRIVTCGIYLNKCGTDYKGGELEFPALDLSIPPTSGLLVAYPSDERFEHQVPVIQAGIRHSILLWFTNNADLSEKRLD